MYLTQRRYQRTFKKSTLISNKKFRLRTFYRNSEKNGMWKCAAHESELRTLKYPTVRTELRTFYSNSYKNSPPATNWITNIYRNNCKTYSSEKKKAIVSSAILVLELRTKRSSCRWLYNWFIRNYAVSYRVPDMLILLQFYHLPIHINNSPNTNTNSIDSLSCGEKM